MAKLTRLTGKLFGETATATGDNPQIGQFGSGLVGTYVGTTDVATIQNLAAWSNGFIGCVTPSTQYPPLPEMTGFGKVLSYQENYLLQQGIPEWDSATDYHINGYCSYNGVIYKSLTNNNLNNNPASSTANWVEYTPSELNNLANKDLSNLTATGENHFANLSLSNLTSTGDSRLHALKGYADKGELLTDSEGLADVKNYAHSTFDKSKFTKQGSLNITSDGLASGFNGGNYIKTNTSIPVDKDFVLRFEYTVTANFLTKYNSNQQYVIGGTYNSENDVVPILFEHTNSANKIVRFILVLNNSGSNQTETLNSSQFNIALGDVIRAELSRKNGTYTAKYYKNGVQIGNNVASLSTNNLVFESNLIIGQYKSNWANQAFAGSTDLKQFSITVDGVEVFSGNKTGVDTVKADDYTKVGSPTITDDGILTGYSTSNYLKKSVSITGNEIIVKCGFKILESMPVGDQYNILQSVDGTAKIYLSVRNVSGVYKTAVYIGDGTTNGFSGIQDLSVGVYYLTVMTFNIANHTNTTKMYTLDGTLVGTNSYTLPNALLDKYFRITNRKYKYKRRSGC